MCVCLPPSYGRRTSGVRVLWVVARSSALHTDHMSGTTVTTFVAGAVGFIGREVGRVFHRAGGSRRRTAGTDRKMKRFGPPLLLALPFVVALVPEVVDSMPTIDVTVSPYAFSPCWRDGRTDAEGGRHVRDQLLQVPRTRSWSHEGLVDRDAARLNAK